MNIVFMRLKLQMVIVESINISGIMKNLMLFLLSLTFLSCTSQTKDNEVNMEGKEMAVFGAGCFWCIEAVFTELEGVESVVSGYTGGNVENPTYKAVCKGETGHAEVAKIIFDPSIISFKELLAVFWQTHDPTTLNKQGYDVGTQYRSAIFFSSKEQKEIATFYKQELDASGAWENPIVTEITELGKFYIAEDYHQDYYELHGEEQYCKYVIQPKVEKFKKAFANKLKK